MQKAVQPMWFFLFILFISSCGPGNPTADEKQDGMTVMTEASSRQELTPMALYFKENLSAYPQDIHFFENKEIQSRIKLLVGDDYTSMLEKFNVQSPIVHDGDVYKTTGCEKHNCPAFHTSIYYDAGSDNFNVIIDRAGEVVTWQEHGIIIVSERLKNM